MHLNPKQIRFCQEYVIDLNGTQAMIRAGYSPRSARAMAADILTKQNIQLYIADLQEGIRQRSELSADLVISELRSLAMWNIKDFIGRGNEVNDLSVMERKALRPVTGIKTVCKWEEDKKGNMVKVTTTELKLADKRASLELLGRHLGVFKDDAGQKLIRIKVTRK